MTIEPKCKCGTRMKKWFMGFDLHGFDVFECPSCYMTMKKVPLGNPDGFMFWTVNAILYFLFGIHKKIWWSREKSK
jgi:hypothetical protein